MTKRTQKDEPTVLTVSMSVGLKRRLKREARRAKLSLSKYIRLTLERELDNQEINSPRSPARD